MTALVAIDGLRGLHQDLIALTEGQLHRIDTLQAELEAHIEAFRKLLDKSPKNNASRQQLLSQGKFSRI